MEPTGLIAFLLGNIVVGIVGAFVGGFLFGLVGLSAGSGLVGSLITAVVGAAVLLFIVGLLSKCEQSLEFRSIARRSRGPSPALWRLARPSRAS